VVVEAGNTVERLEDPAEKTVGLFRAGFEELAGGTRGECNCNVTENPESEGVLGVEEVIGVGRHPGFLDGVAAVCNPRQEGLKLPNALVVGDGCVELANISGLLSAHFLQLYFLGVGGAEGECGAVVWPAKNPMESFVANCPDVAAWRVCV
jgi:hypothetical protein